MSNELACSRNISTATSDPTVMARLAALNTALRRRRLASRMPRRIGTGNREEAAIVHPSAPRLAGRVGQGADSASPGGPDRRHQRRHDGHGDCGAEHDQDRRKVERWRAGRADEARARVREERRREPTDHETHRCRDEGKGQLLREKNPGHESGRRADGLQQPDPSRLLFHPAADKQGNAREGEEP